MPLSAFEAKLMELQDNLFGLACKLTSNREEAKDLLQETLLKALVNKDKYTEDLGFKGWLFTIMKHLFYNDYRKTVRHLTFVDVTEDLYYLNMPMNPIFETPEESLSVKDIIVRVNGLSDEYRIPFSMHLSGYKYHEIAEQIGLLEGTVKSRIHTARAKLKEKLTDYR